MLTWPDPDSPDSPTADPDSPTDDSIQTTAADRPVPRQARPGWNGGLAETWVMVEL
jgi:hypothetical protein